MVLLCSPWNIFEEVLFFPGLRYFGIPPNLPGLRYFGSPPNPSFFYRISFPCIFFQTENYFRRMEYSNPDQLVEQSCALYSHRNLTNHTIQARHFFSYVLQIVTKKTSKYRLPKFDVMY